MKYDEKDGIYYYIGTQAEVFTTAERFALDGESDEAKEIRKISGKDNKKFLEILEERKKKNLAKAKELNMLVQVDIIRGLMCVKKENNAKKDVVLEYMAPNGNHYYKRLHDVDIEGITPLGTAKPLTEHIKHLININK